MLKQGKQECGGSHCTVLLKPFLEKDQLKGRERRERQKEMENRGDRKIQAGPGQGAQHKQMGFQKETTGEIISKIA